MLVYGTILCYLIFVSGHLDGGEMNIGREWIANVIVIFGRLLIMAANFGMDCKYRGLWKLSPRNFRIYIKTFFVGYFNGAPLLRTTLRYIVLIVTNKMTFSACCSIYIYPRRISEISPRRSRGDFRIFTEVEIHPKGQYRALGEA